MRLPTHAGLGLTLLALSAVAVSCSERPGLPETYELIESITDCDELATVQSEHLNAAEYLNERGQYDEASVYLSYAQADAERAEELGCPWA